MNFPFLPRLKSASAAFTAFYHRLPWASRRREASLLMRLMIIACIWGVVIFALAIVGLWWTAGQVIQDNVRRQSIQWLNKFDELGTPLFISGDPLQFESIRKYIVSFPEVSFLRYVAIDGHTELASYFAHDIEPSSVGALSDAQLKTLRQVAEGEEKPRSMEEIPGRAILRVSSPAVIRSIPSDGLLNFSIKQTAKEQVRVIGFVDIGFNYSVYREHLWQRILYGSGLILGLFIATFLLGQTVIRQALRPLVDLQIPLGKLARGETDIHVDSHGVSEIMAIGNALNTTIAALKERDQELNRLAHFDSLTGLLNRHSFNHELEREKARILLDHHVSGLLFIDLDRFKEVNDSVGHAAGDKLLIQVARLLRTTVRNSDIVSRLGGDEFTIILIDVSEEHAAKVAEQICTAMRGFSFSAEGQTFHVPCSIGLTMIDATPTSASTILSQADTACHEAKMAGRNGFRRFRGIEDAPSLQLNGIGLREQLETALRDQAFSLSYAPIRGRNGGPIRSFGVQLYMRAIGDEIPAAAFSSSAERFDLIQQIDRMVITLALRQFKTCDESVRLSIPISTKTLQQNGILEFVSSAFARERIAPERLIFEIPERAILDNVTQTKNFMEGIRELGCAIAIDDFGVSLNAINLLRELPVNQLKLDAAIVNDIATPIGHAVVTLIVQVARELGIQTVAKHVSQIDDAHRLEQLGIDQLQGDLVGRPVAQLPQSTPTG